MSCTKALRKIHSLSSSLGRSLSSNSVISSRILRCPSGTYKVPSLVGSYSITPYRFSSSDSSCGATRKCFPPRVQFKAPNFKGTAVMPNGEFKTIELCDFAGKYLYLFFYPLDFTFVCPTEIVAFSDRMNEFTQCNTCIVGVSCDSQFSHFAWTNMDRKLGGVGKLAYPLLSDINKTIAEDYDVLVPNEGIPLRASFLIDDKSCIRQITINDLPVGRSVDEVLRLIKAFQYTDKHGEVCPANWDQDKPTIKPNPKESQEYFSKVN